MLWGCFGFEASDEGLEDAVGFVEDGHRQLFMTQKAKLFREQQLSAKLKK